jgi:hypothetical protein
MRSLSPVRPASARGTFANCCPNPSERRSDSGVTAVTVLDEFIYSGNGANLAPVADHAGLTFVRGEICDAPIAPREESVGQAQAWPGFAERRPANGS